MELLARMIVYLVSLVIYVLRHQRMGSPVRLVTSVLKAVNLKLYDALPELTIVELGLATQLDVGLVPADTFVVHQQKTPGDQLQLTAA